MSIYLVCCFVIDHLYRGLMERDEWRNLGLAEVRPTENTPQDAGQKASC